MATFTLFEEFIDNLGGNEYAFGADTVKLALITSAVTPTADDATPTWSDYSGSEVVGTGYSAGGTEITNDTFTEADGVATYDGDDVVWDYNAAGPTNVRWGILYDDTHASKHAIGFVDFGGTVSFRTGAVGVHWGSGGIFEIEIGGVPVQDGVIYVSPNGNDSWSGKSWTRPKLTIAAAVALMATDYPKGGKILLDRGTFTLNELTITTPGVCIQGASPSATELRCAAAATYGIKLIGAWRFTMTDVWITDEATFAGRALWISDDSDWCCLDRVWFHYLSDDYAGSDATTTAPAAIYLDGPADANDWHKFHAIECWNCYRGIVVASNSNYTLTDSTMRNMYHECILSEAPSYQQGDINIANCWFAGQTGSIAGYMIKLNNASDLMIWSNSKIVNCETELHENNIRDHIYVDWRNVMIDNHKFGGGGSVSDSPIGVYFDTNSRGCVLGMCRRSGTNAYSPAVIDYGTANEKWYGQYGTTPTALNDVWSATASATITADTASGNAVSLLEANRPVMVGPHILNVVSVTDDDTVVLNHAITVDSVTVRVLPWDWN